MPQLALYLGVCYLHLNDAARAAEILSTARENAPSELVDDVDWYLAIADARAGNLPRARAELNRLCDGGSDVALKACLAAAELRP